MSDKKYFRYVNEDDEEPTPQTLNQMFRLEPDWAMSRFRFMEDKIEQLQAERRWISVKDRLPDKDQDQFVIAYHVHWGIELTQWYQNRWREIGLDGDSPSHWMPLPKPPEEKT